MIKLADALSSITKVGIDTSPFIYLIERQTPYYVVVRSVFERIQANSLTACTSVITLAEVLVIPLRAKNPPLENAYRRILTHSANLEMIPLTAEIAERAAHLRATYNLKTPDALHLASAIISGCNAFLSNDRGFSRVHDIKIIILADLEL